MSATKERIFSYIRRHCLPTGWWHIMEAHAEKAWALDPNASFYIVDDYGGIRIDTITTHEADQVMRFADEDLLWQSKATCSCCGKQFREIVHDYAYRRELCMDCRYLDARGQEKVQFEAARKWFMEE